MADDASPTPPDKQLVQWLRALADAVEGDPALANRVTQGLATPPPASAEVAPFVADAAPSPSAPEPSLAAAPSPAPEAVLAVAAAPMALPPDGASGEPPPAPETIAPTLRHTRKVSRFGPSVAGRPADLGTGVSDPFAVFAKDGEDGLRQALAALRVGTLRAIIRAHDLDPAGKIAASATEKRLVTAIIAAVKRAGAAPTRKPRAKASPPRNRPTPPVIH